MGPLDKRPDLKCKFPPCPCEVCRESRRQGKKDRGECGSENNLANEPPNFLYFLAEAMGIIAFFIVATTMFWMAVAYYAFQLGVKIYHSNRNTQIAAVVITLLLILSITISIMRRNLQRSKCTKSSSAPSPVKKQHLIPHKKGEKIEIVPKDDKSWPQVTVTTVTKTKTKTKDQPTAKPATITKNITVTITDSEARQVFKQSKLFAIPTEMKHPPAILADDMDFCWLPFPFRRIDSRCKAH